LNECIDRGRPLKLGGGRGKCVSENIILHGPEPN